MYENTERRYTAEEREITEIRLRESEEKIAKIAPKAIPGTVLAECTLKRLYDEVARCKELLRIMDEHGVVDEDDET